MATYCAVVYPAFYVLDLLVTPRYLSHSHTSARRHALSLLASCASSVGPTALRRLAQIAPVEKKEP
ncbi:MAG: hypothetical protein V3V08_24855 [Nannocystaceae bacterium]